MSEEKMLDIESMSSKDALGYFLPKVDEDARQAKIPNSVACQIETLIFSLLS